MLGLRHRYSLSATKVKHPNRLVCVQSARIILQGDAGPPGRSSGRSLAFHGFVG